MRSAPSFSITARWCMKTRRQGSSMTPKPWTAGSAWPCIDGRTHPFAPTRTYSHLLAPTRTYSHLLAPIRTGDLRHTDFLQESFMNTATITVHGAREAARSNFPLDRWYVAAFSS